MFEVKTEILCNIFLLDHHNNVLIVFLNTFRSVQLNLSGCMHKQECIKYCLISKMPTHLPMMVFPHSVTKG